jgi:Domain of unknown function (DUF4157)
MSSATLRQSTAARPTAGGCPNLVLQRKCACGSSASDLSGECEDCGKKKLGRHRKLFVGSRDDPREREADRTADQVKATPSGSPFGQAPSSRRLTSAGSPSREAELAPASIEAALAEGGTALEPALRQDMEARFRHDFSRVRIHLDAKAADSARDVQARAYTVGNDIVFGAGFYAPSTPGGGRLLAHELTHVMQQAGSNDLVQRDLIYGSGYPNPFAGKPADETAAASKDPREWFPSSVDFAETAKLSGGGTGRATLADLLAQIRGHSPGSVTDIDLIGHANADLFALGGTITRHSVSGTQGGTIGATQLAKAQPDIEAVRDRFAAGAHITLYGCNSGASGSLLQAISTAFKVCARGFKDPIDWCLGWQTGPLVINSRGRTLINPPAKTPCDQYNGSVYNLNPDTEDCSGTRPKAPDIDLPKRKPTVPQLPE